MWSALFKRRPGRQVVMGDASWAVFDPVSGWQSGTSAGVAQVLDACCAALADSGGLPRKSQGLTVWLTGRLCPALFLTPPTGLRPGAEWQAWLRAAAASPTAGAASSPTPSVLWCEAEDPRPSVAARLDAQLLATVQQRLGVHGRLLGLRPLWRAATEHVAQAPMAAPLQLLTVFDGTTATALACDAEGRITEAQTRDSTEAASLAWHRRRSAVLDPSTQRWLRWQAPTAPSASGSASTPAWHDAWQPAQAPLQ